MGTCWISRNEGILDKWVDLEKGGYEEMQILLMKNQKTTKISALNHKNIVILAKKHEVKSNCRVWKSFQK